MEQPITIATTTDSGDDSAVKIKMFKTKSSQLEEQNKAALKDYLRKKDPNAPICK